MFSLPFVVANAVVNQAVDPATMQPGSAPFRDAEAFCDRVHVEVSEDFDSYLPDRRCTEVVVEFSDGTWVGLCQPNPLGDADYFPLSLGEVHQKLVSLIGEETTRTIEDALATLPGERSAADVLRGLLRKERPRPSR
jgi:2-methylcitrate dehydratase PrpD